MNLSDLYERYYERILKYGFKSKKVYLMSCFKQKQKLHSIYNIYANFYRKEIWDTIVSVSLFIEMMNYMNDRNIIEEFSDRILDDDDLNFHPEIFEHHYKIINESPFDLQDFKDYQMNSKYKTLFGNIVKLK